MPTPADIISTIRKHCTHTEHETQADEPIEKYGDLTEEQRAEIDGMFVEMKTNLESKEVIKREATSPDYKHWNKSSKEARAEASGDLSAAMQRLKGSQKVDKEFLEEVKQRQMEE